jgi:hypothetical protein
MEISKLFAKDYNWLLQCANVLRLTMIMRQVVVRAGEKKLASTMWVSNELQSEFLINF